MSEDIQNKIKNILFEIGREIKIYKLDSENSIIEIDYEKYTKQILDILGNENE